jgi:hypothetical protein
MVQKTSMSVYADDGTNWTWRLWNWTKQRTSCGRTQQHDGPVLQTVTWLSPQNSANKYFNENVAWTNETKYPGVILDSKWTHNARVSSLGSKRNGTQTQLFPVLNKFLTFDVNLSLTVHEAFLRSILTCAAPCPRPEDVQRTLMYINCRRCKMKSWG